MSELCNIPNTAPLNLCGIQPEDYNCNISTLINTESCVGSAVYTINSNFVKIDSFLNDIKKDIYKNQDTINKLIALKDRWEQAYLCVCSSSAKWIDMYEAAIDVDTTIRPPILAFYPQIFEEDVWNSYTTPEKDNIKNLYVTTWVNNSFPAYNYPANSRLICCLLLRRNTFIDIDILGATAPTGAPGCGTVITCPFTGKVIDRYTISKVEVSFSLQTTSSGFEWKI